MTEKIFDQKYTISQSDLKNSKTRKWKDSVCSAIKRFNTPIYNKIKKNRMSVEFFSSDETFIIKWIWFTKNKRELKQINELFILDKE